MRRGGMLRRGDNRPHWLFDPATKDSDVALSVGNAYATANSSNGSAVSDVSRNGIYYTEVKVLAIGGGMAIGVTSSSFDPSSGSVVGGSTGSLAYKSNGDIYRDGVFLDAFLPYTTGDYMGMAFDSSAGKMWFYPKTTWLPGIPPSGSSYACTFTPTRIGVHLINAAQVRVPDALANPPHKPTGYGAF